MDDDLDLERRLREREERRREQAAAEDAEREATKKLVAPLFGDLSNEQPRYHRIDRDQLVRLRQENNIKRPTYYGFLIDDLLTTSAALLAERDQTRDELEIALGFHRVAVAERDYERFRVNKLEAELKRLREDIRSRDPDEPS